MNSKIPISPKDENNIDLSETENMEKIEDKQITQDSNYPIVQEDVINENNTELEISQNPEYPPYFENTKNLESEINEFYFAWSEDEGIMALKQKYKGIYTEEVLNEIKEYTSSQTLESKLKILLKCSTKVLESFLKLFLESEGLSNVLQGDKEFYVLFKRTLLKYRVGTMLKKVDQPEYELIMHLYLIVAGLHKHNKNIKNPLINKVQKENEQS